MSTGFTIGWAPGKFWVAAVLLMAAALPGRADIIGADLPTSFSLCEAAQDASQAPRPECQAGDVRFQADTGAETDFGFSIASGNLNGDDFEDLVVGDPARNSVYVFFGRPSVTASYDLDPGELDDRMVSAETQADVILRLAPAQQGQIGSFGFSVAIGEEPIAATCPPSDFASALVIGAPGQPGTTGNPPGAAVHVPAGALCFVPANPPAATVVDPLSIGQAIRSPVVEDDDEFGFSVALGRLLTSTGTDEDVIVGARSAGADSGKVVAFPVNDGTVGIGINQVVQVVGAPGEQLGEVLAVGDLDADFDPVLDPFGGSDDLAIGGVGDEGGRVLLVQGPLPPGGGVNGDGVFEEGDTRLKAIAGEFDGDFFGFSVAISNEGRLAVGAVFADNEAPADDEAGTPGGDPLTNVGTAGRINAGKAYLWEPGIFDFAEPVVEARTADLVMIARRSGDQLGFAVAFADLDVSGVDDFVVAARREDGSGLRIDEIDQGTVYILFDDSTPSSPVDLGQCVTASDCTGVAGIDVMLFGGDREAGSGDQIGFALAAGNFNGDLSDDLFVSSVELNRVYAVTLDDTDEDRDFQGRNIRDDDDDEDGDPDSSDCDPQDPSINSEADEITCNSFDENCNGLEDDAPDADGDGFDACGAAGATDCDDDDASSFPGAAELCDGNDNACAGQIPVAERDLDGDSYVECAGWDDAQGDDVDILGGNDCAPSRSDTFPGAAPNEANPVACMTDVDEDDWGDSTPPAGVIPGTDCDDGIATTFPGAAQLDDPTGCMSDADDDGYGDIAAVPPRLPGTDCADTDPNSFPGAAEMCDGNDNDCGGVLPPDETDADGDGYVECAAWNDTQGDDVAILGGGDCAIMDGSTFPGASPNEAVPTACTKDADGDDYGDLAPPAGVSAGTDCDDDSPAAAATFPGAASVDGPLNCMKDSDGDDHGDDSVALPVVAGSDCDDDDASIFTGATEVLDDGIDQDCSGSDALNCFEDADEDGFGSAVTVIGDDGDCTDPGESDVDTDCDDGDADIFPGRAEIADDGIDQDCNDFDTITCTVDADEDGSGTTVGTTVLADDGSCDADQQESATADDCDDADPDTFPGAPELCDGNDNACLGSVPVDEIDGDADTYVGCSNWNDSQGDDPGVSGGDDCDDTSSSTFPGAAVNEPVGGACMKDVDGDGFGDIAPPAGVAVGTDCDDESPSAASTFPGAAAADGPLNCMKDSDGDDHGDAAVALPVVPGTDCDDTDPATFGAAPELCDGNDNSCAGSVPADEIDVDLDGYVACMGWNDVQGDDAGIVGGGDCDETEIDTYPGAAPNEAFSGACMQDKDGDDYGELSPPPGVTPGTDCDDDSASTFLGAAALDGPFNCMKDGDGDDYGDTDSVLPVVAGTDCDDAIPSVNPGMMEGPQGAAICADGLDNDCDTLADNDDPVCAGNAAACPDADNDGFADCATDPNCDFAGLVCGDCDDAVGAVNPGAAEVCDNVDNDCNSLVDEGFDADGDDFTSCDLPAPDCDDTNAAVNPNAVELCGDGLDNDCDAGTVDLFDADSDGSNCSVDCNDADPALNNSDADADLFSTCAGDCNDADAAINPGAAEVCSDGVDNDCNGATPDVGDGDMDGADCDVDCNDADPALNLDDADSDTFSTCAGDCDDGNPAVSPAAVESCDGVDNNCDGTVDEAFDLDSDGFSTCSTPVPDCNDGNPMVNPGEAEVCNDGVDNDCNAATPDIFDGDADGATCILDCDDNDPNSFPGAGELCDGNDNDCNGMAPADESDVDGDGYVACVGWNDTQADNPEILGGDDCDETDIDTFPGAAPNEAFATGCMQDRDGDDFGDLDPPPGVTAGTDCDDESAAASSTFPGAAPADGPLNCMKDVDDDEYGDAAVALPVVAGTDCDDDVAAVSPGIVEGPMGNPTCTDTLDNDCDTFVDAADADCNQMRSPPRRTQGPRPRAGRTRAPVGTRGR